MPRKRRSGEAHITSIRNEYLPKLWAEAKRRATYPTTFKQLLELMASLPTDRYYISEEEGLRAVFQYKPRKNHYKDLLFRSFLDLYHDLRNTEKYKNVAAYKLVAICLSHPAPCIGLSPRSLQRIVSKYHPQWL